MSDEQDFFGIELIAAIRGGIPEKCDFCEQPYTETRTPVPEEAQAWACSECWDRWEAELAAKNADQK